MKQFSIRLSEPLRAHFQARADALAMPLARYIVFRLTEVYTIDTATKLSEVSVLNAIGAAEQTSALIVADDGKGPKLEW